MITLAISFFLTTSITVWALLKLSELWAIILVIAGGAILSLSVFLSVNYLFLEQDEEKFVVWDVQAANITFVSFICLAIAKILGKQ